MAKLTLTNLSSLQNEQSAINIINNNNDAIEAAVEKTLSRNGTTPNQMTAELDMNSQRILNLPQPLTDNEPARLADLEEIIGSTGDGNVLGPSSSVGGNIAVFSGNTGKLLADGGASVASKADVSSPTISNPTFTGLTTLNGNMKMGANTASIEIGSTTVSNTPYIDFHSSGNNNDYDSRIIASGGTGSPGQGSLNIQAGGGLTVAGNLGISGSYAGDGTSLTGVETSAHATATYSPITRTFVSVPGTTYTLLLTDAGNILVTSSGSATTITIPLNSSVAFPIGTQIECIQFGAGKVTFAGAVGVTIFSTNSNKSISAQYGGVTLVKGSTDGWYLIGSLIA